MQQAILEQYIHSSQRLFLLDYDGTLAEFQMTPSKATLTPAEADVLRDLCQESQNTIVIISGRSQVQLDNRLGDLPLNLAAEYGHFTKEHGASWHTRGDHHTAWKKTVEPILAAAVAEIPDSFIEEKAFSLVWHYRQSDAALAQPVAKRLLAKLTPAAEALDLCLMDGNKVVEVMANGSDKAAVAHSWLGRQSWDFVLAAGDDVADEELFQAMPKSACTIKIGKGKTAARYRLPTPQALSSLLRALTVS